MPKTPIPIPQKLVCKLCGLKRRQVAILANAGAIPGAKRGTDGVHFAYFDGRAFQAWAETQRAKQAARHEWPKPSLTPSKNAALVTIEGIASYFELWKRKVANQLADSDPAFREGVREVTREMWEILRLFHEQDDELLMNVTVAPRGSDILELN